MIPAKLAALCLCPALIATPAVIATHPKMRHAVAHLMHRAANQLEAPAAAEPLGHCPASYDSDAPTSLNSDQPAGLSGLALQDLSALQSPVGPADAAYGGIGQAGTANFGSLPMGGIGTSNFANPAANPTPPAGIVTPPTQAEGVTEPQNWALLLTGFAATGLLLRWKRPQQA